MRLYFKLVHRALLSTGPRISHTPTLPPVSMPVAELIAIVGLGGQAIKFLIKFQPSKVLDNAIAMEHEAVALIAADDLKGMLGEDQLQVLEAIQARINRKKLGLPNALTVKEIIKRPKVFFKARALHTACEEFLNTARWITTAVMAEQMGQPPTEIALDGRVGEASCHGAGGVDEPPSYTKPSGKNPGVTSNAEHTQDDAFVKVNYRRNHRLDIQEMNLELSYRRPNDQPPASVRVCISPGGQPGAETATVEVGL
ncbi:hypothetical protein BC628DRAFT_530733 [Trametes gibbosa]|nr:hypothetical protein BC628DRAFT_530733 [Trametes gibbosa]